MNTSATEEMRFEHSRILGYIKACLYFLVMYLSCCGIFLRVCCVFQSSTVCDHWLEMSPQEPLTVKGMLGVLNACCVTLKVAATSTHTHKVV